MMTIIVQTIAMDVKIVRLTLILVHIMMRIAIKVEAVMAKNVFLSILLKISTVKVAIGDDRANEVLNPKNVKIRFFNYHNYRAFFGLDQSAKPTELYRLTKLYKGRLLVQQNNSRLYLHFYKKLDHLV